MKSAHWIFTLLFGSAAIALATGCLTDSDDDGGDASGSQTWSEPVDVVEGYGFCSENIYSLCVDAEGESWQSGGSAPDGMMGSDNDGSDCLCGRSCQSAANCPTPDTGTSTPACASIDGQFRTCVLPCEDGQTCPDGMTCRSVFDASVGAICTWHDPHEDSVFMYPEVCGERTTREDCEAALSHYPIEPNYRCAWTKETVIERDDVACETPTVVERCVAVQVELGESVVCEAGRNCEGARGPLYWTELGAGDISLMQLERCDLRPHTMGQGEYEACDFAATPTAPSVCDCACSD